jgi:hypothetical protein
MSDNAFIGVDWGTHSSKLCISSAQTYIDAPLFSSDIVSADGQIAFGIGEHMKEDEIVRGLKGDLIKNSLSARFWSAENRLDTDTSLGEAVAFSLACLIAEAKSIVRDKVAGTSFKGAELGFSFPNWLAEDGRKSAVAAQNFCEAAQVAVAVVLQCPDDATPHPGKPYPIAKWKRTIDATRAGLAGTQLSSITLESANRTEFCLSGDGPTWRFIVESGAAGIPYLRNMRLPKNLGVRGLGKLLVVDVGAGSTDVGYMLRTINVQSGEPTFYHLRPASALPVAGNQLTEDLQKHFRAQDRLMGYREAEAQKTSGSSWGNLPFVSAWIKQICDHVETYVHGIPDHRWLPVEIPLNIVVTGGSGLVPGLREKLVESVQNALSARNFESKTCKAVRAVNRYEPRFDFKTEADVARRAVCFGAADPDKPNFRYVPKFDPYTQAPKPAPKWV